MIRVKQIVIVGGFDDQRRGAPAIIKRGMFDLAKTWHKKFLPGHFTRGAPQKYKYEKRAPTYAAIKRFERKPPLVWSGQTKARARALFHVTGSAKRLIGKFTLPRYIRMHKSIRRSRGEAGEAGDTHELPAMGVEITRTRPKERRFLEKRLQGRVITGLGNLKTRKVIRI